MSTSTSADNFRDWPEYQAALRAGTDIRTAYSTKEYLTFEARALQVGDSRVARDQITAIGMALALKLAAPAAKRPEAPK